MGKLTSGDPSDSADISSYLNSAAISRITDRKTDRKFDLTDRKFLADDSYLPPTPTNRMDPSTAGGQLGDWSKPQLIVSPIFSV